MLEIQPQHINLGTLLSNRLFRIPQYQRSYSWTSKQRRDLFDDIRRSYKGQGPNDHFMATIVGLRRETVNIIVDQYQKIDIVDGQQRVTTLVLLLRAIAKHLDLSDEIELKISNEIKETLIKADKASQLLLQTNHDADDYFATYIREGAYENPEKATTLAGKQLLMAMTECERFVKDWRDGGTSLVELIAHLRNRLTFIFHEIADESMVYTVFEVLNSRGLDVSWFDRLKSMLMAIVFETDNENKEEIIKQVHTLWGDVYDIIGLRMGLSNESLRFTATLYSDDELSRPLGAEQAAIALRNKAENDLEEVIRVTQRLKSVTKAVDELWENRRLNAVTRIQQARLVATAVNLRDDLQSSDKELILRQWEKVTFRIYGMLKKDARTAVGEYSRLAWNITNRNLSTEDVIDELKQIGKKFPINEVIEELGKEINSYEGWGDELRYFLHRYEEHLTEQAGQPFENEHWNHIWAVSTSESIEHIMPQSSKKGYVHYLGNLLLLPPKLNSKLGDKQPKEKEKAYRATGMRIAVKAADQVKEGWNEKKVLAREGELLEWAKQEWGD